MSEMIERVTWAVCPILRAADECDMPQIINGPRPECRKCPAVESRSGTAGCRIVAELVARDAIEAMREPTAAMLDRGYIAYGVVSGIWHAMINAALISERGAEE